MKPKLIKVLIATYDHTLAKSYADRLGGSHFDVAQTADSASVLQDCLRFQPDFILIDTELTNEEHDLLDILRHTPETEHTKIILLTSLIDPNLRARAHELGAVDVIIKSRGTIPEVINRIHYHLGRPKTAR